MEKRRGRDDVQDDDEDKEMKDGCERGLFDWFLFLFFFSSLSFPLSLSFFLSFVHSQHKSNISMNKNSQ